MENKVGMAEALKDTGMLDKPKENTDKGPSKSISFKDLPPRGKVELAAQAGIDLDENEIAQDELEQKQQEADIQERQLQIKEKSVKKGVSK